jgi:hypothetical protein
MARRLPVYTGLHLQSGRRITRDPRHTIKIGIVAGKQGQVVMVIRARISASFVSKPCCRLSVAAADASDPAMASTWILDCRTLSTAV